MTTESTIFKVKDGYILLEDLESWYSNGLITSEDRIQIFENNERIGGKRMGDYRVDNLIKIYGDQFPFRRIPLPYEHDPLTAYTSDEDDGESVRSVSRAGSPISLEQPSGAANAPPPKTMGGAFGAPKRIDPSSTLPVPRGMSSGTTSQDSYATAPTSIGGAFGARNRAPNPVEVSSDQQEPFQDLADVHDDMPPRVDQNHRIEYRDYPLYSLHNEPEEDRITGMDVIREMSQLRNRLTLNKWSRTDKDYFYFLNRHNFPEYSSMAICRLCNHTPYGGKLFFQHLFHPMHAKKLSEHYVSRKSFLFWQEHIDKCRRPAVTVPTVPATTATVPPKDQPKDQPAPTSTSDFSMITKIFKTIPLFTSGPNTEKPKLEPEEISNFMELFSKIDPSSWSGGDDFLSLYFEKVDCSMFCDPCGEEMAHRSYKFARHLFTERHLKSLKNISQRDINFWINILNLEASAKNVKPADVVRTLTMRNKRPIPLLDFKLEVVPFQRSFRMPKIEELHNIYKNIKKEQYSTSCAALIDSTGTLLHQNVSCFACDLPKNSFLSLVELVDHIFSDAHVRYLVQFGFSEKAYLWWKKFLEDVANGTPVPPRDQSEEPMPSAPISQIPKRGKSEEPISASNASPKTSTNNGSTRISVRNFHVRTVNTNGSRIPMMHLPENEASMSDQNEFVKKIKEMTNSLTPFGKEQAKKAVVKWNCEYCKVNNFINKLAVFNHITSQKHREKMKFTAPSQDLNYWINWASTISLTPSKPSPQPEVVGEARRVRKNPRVKGMSDDIPVISKFPPNNPRVPMLDQIPPNTRVVQCDKPILRRSYNKFYMRGPATTDLAKAMLVNCICTYCEQADGVPTKLDNMLSVYDHINTEKHWANMKRTASLEDVSYWRNLGTRLSAAYKPNEPSEPVSRDPSVPILDKSATDGTTNAKNPRVPMLDKLSADETIVTKERFNQVLNECVKLFNRGGKKMHIAKTFINRFVCSFCSSPGKETQASTWLDAFLHITKEKHRKNMDYKASEADLQYWKDWVKQLAEIAKSDKNAVAETVKNDRSVLAVFSVLAEQVKQKNAEKLRMVNQRNKEATAAFPLLVAPKVADAFFMTKAEYQSRYEAIAAKLSLLESSKITDSMVNGTCSYCPDSPRMITLFDVMKHVFTTDHDKNSNYKGTDAEFQFYEKLLHDMAPKNLPPNDPEPSDPAKSTTLTTTTGFFPLPLLGANPSGRPVLFSSLCVGPTIAQILFVQSKHPLSIQIASKVGCELCKIDMTDWCYSKAAGHAFTVGHLDKLRKTGYQFVKEDFVWWIKWLQEYSRLPCPIEECSQFCLGIYNPPASNPDSQIFVSFNAQETKLIENVDSSKLDLLEERILSEFGGCSFCNQWNFTPIGIVYHYTSDGHFANVRRVRPAIRTDADEILTIVKACQKTVEKQKDSSSCSIM